MNKSCPKKNSFGCMNVRGLSLLDHQKKICKFMLDPNHRGVLVFHSVGSGKTLTSIVAAKCLLEKTKKKKLIIVTPASLVSNFQKELNKVPFNTGDLTITLESYDKFIREPSASCRNSILILDEVHNLNAEAGVKFRKMFECSKLADKVILLSATPVKNIPAEIANQISLLTGVKLTRHILDKVLEMKDSPRKTQLFNQLFKCKISFSLIN